MRLLDLFCGGGGAAMGYHRAGWEVIGVDRAPQPHYPFEFHRADALTFPLDGFDAIHASPPCQAWVALAKGDHPELIVPTRERLRASGVPYVIENVVGAPVQNPTILCGSMFGLGVRRHRLFESNMLLLAPGRCRHREQGEIRAYYGNPSLIAWSAQNSGRVARGEESRPLYRGTVALGADDMGIDWMTWDELREAIPPAYTEHLGAQLLVYV